MSTSTTSCDIIVIGAGIAGASAAAELAAVLPGAGRIALIERESQPGYHTTGRSAAVYTPSYGSEKVRRLVLASGDFLRSPPEGFCAASLLGPRGMMSVYQSSQIDLLERDLEALGSTTPDIMRLDAAGARDIVPVLDPAYVAGALYSAATLDLDVHALHQGYLRAFKGHGGVLHVNAEVTAISRHSAGADWSIETRRPGGESTTFSAPVIVNAAGAWCDEIARLAGVSPIGLVPKRRNVALIDIAADLPAGVSLDVWPLTFGPEPSFYFKPDAGKLMISPEDAIASPPCDARPEDIDIAIAIDRFETVTTLSVRRPEHTWAGLRSFVEDDMLVAGFDDEHAGFFWLAAQGGYGIETSPAMATISAALATGGDFPAFVSDHGLNADDLSPKRLR